MDKNAIKKYAASARRELIARVSQKAEQYGITEREIIDERAESIHGAVLTPAQIEQRRALIRLIRRDGYRQAMEEVAYTWFNRFMALRFMEVNDYLPGHTRAFSDDRNAFKPRILSDALDLELNGLDIDKVIALKEANDTETLYQYLLITLCNHLSGILPGMFQRINDYTELLFPEHLLREGSVLEQLIAMIPQEDWLDAVQIIGWLYQYYNAEPKDQVFANLKKNIKISKENIPAATQLFTPDWIVRYMVENSLGRLWVEGHPDDGLKANWKYYLEEAEQAPEVQAQLRAIREQYAQMKPEEILCVDPCAGSGHILVYLFDVLVQIYETYGYPTRAAVASIVRNNLWGLDIDDRAAQLAYFAVMMKARQYDKGWFRRGIEPNVFALRDSPELTEDTYACFGDHADAARRVIDAFRDAKEYGSIIQPNVTLDELDQLEQVLLQQDEMADFGSLSAQIAVGKMIADMSPMIRQARALVQKYHVVVTNPPYMSSSGMNAVLLAFVKENYKEGRYDLSTVFMIKNSKLCRENGFYSMINIPVWMFISSYFELRQMVLKYDCFVNMLHFGRGVFGSDFGSTSFTIRKSDLDRYEASFLKLYEEVGNVDSLQQKKKWFFERRWHYIISKTAFERIPSMTIAYWLTAKEVEIFQTQPSLREIADPRQGLATGNDEEFLRTWSEVNYTAIGFNMPNTEAFMKSGALYAPFNKGGAYRKWYGNNSLVIRFSEMNYNKLLSMGNHLPSRHLYFNSGITWSALTAGDFSGRYCGQGFVFAGKGPMCFPNKKEDSFFLLGYLNSKITSFYMKVFSSTTDFNQGPMRDLPLIMIEGVDREIIDYTVQQSVHLSKIDWDSFETSWDFAEHPIVRWSRSLRDATSIGATMQYYYGYQPEVRSTVELCFLLWQGECNKRFEQLKANEEALNRIFIDIYGLQDELTPEVADKDVTVRKADLGRDIRSLISYAVGCILGRYSIYKNGLMFAGGEWDEQIFLQAIWEERGMQFMEAEGMDLTIDLNPHSVVIPDRYGVVPITDDEYFENDIVRSFVNFIEVVFGKQDLEENLKFIAAALYPNGGGTARDLIRQYFLNDFYKDHLKVYQKRPIYWLFDAGKKNSFKCLIYLHRYRPDTVARVRTDYVHEMQSRYRTAMEELSRRVDAATGSERVRLQKRLAAVQAQDQELRLYEEKIHHYADMMLPLDLDDGVKVNYAKLQDVLAPIK